MADCSHCGMAPAVANGLCAADYNYAKAHEGNLRPGGLLVDQLIRNEDKTLEAMTRRFMIHVQLEDTKPSTKQHWLWTGGRSKDGYGLFAVQRGKRVLAQRVAWAIAHERIPGRLRNLCGVITCVRPAHWTDGG
jgi:hypothetical protein